MSGWLPVRSTAVGFVLALGWALAPRLRAQEPTPAEAYGIYRAADSGAADTAPATAAPADTAPATTAPADTAPADSGPAPGASAAARALEAAGAAVPTPVADTIRLERVEETADDTSLTARMDVWRGGGLRREEFPDLRESAALTGRYTVFLGLIGWDQWGAAPGDTARVTVLAPTDSAFAALPAAALDRLRSDSATRARWAESVVLEGDWPVSALLEAGEVETVAGTAIRVTRGADGRARTGEARVVQPDVTARNGMLHGVDRVTVPDSTAAEATSAVP